MSPYTAGQRGWLLVWLLLSCLCLVFMGDHISDTPVVFGRYSTGYAAMLLLMLALILVTGAGGLMLVLGLWRLPALPGSPWLGWLVLIAAALLVMIIWLLPLSDTPGGRIFRLYLAALVLIILSGVLVRAGVSRLFIGRASSAVVFAAVALITAGLTVLYQNGIVPPNRNFDEGWIAGWSVSLARGDTLLDQMYPTRDPLITGIVSGLSRYGLGHWLQLTGVGLGQGRLYTALLAWLSLPFIFLAARRLYGGVAAWGALVIGALLPLHHSYVYPTGWVALSMAVSLCCYLALRDADQAGAKRPLFALLAGFVSTLGFEGHAYGLAFAGALGAMLVWDYVRGIRHMGRWAWPSDLLWFMLGGFGAVALIVTFRIWITDGVIGLHNLLDVLQMRYLQEEDITGVYSGFWDRLFRANRSLYRIYANELPVEFALLLVSLAAAVWRRLRQPQPGDRILVPLTAFWLLIFGLWIAKSNVYYWLFFMPFITIFSGALIAQVAGWGDRVRFGQALLAVGLFGLLAASTLTMARSQNFNSLVHLGYEIADALPDTVEHVAGWEMYFFGLHPRRYTMTANYLDANRTADLPPPDALILTSGLDDVPELRAYAKAQGMRLARCLPLAAFDGVVRVYLFDDLPAEDAPIGCEMVGE